MTFALVGHYLYQAYKAKKAESLREQQERGTIQEVRAPSPEKTPSALRRISYSAKKAASKVRTHFSSRSTRQAPQDEDCEKLLTSPQQQPESQPTVINYEPGLDGAGTTFHQYAKNTALDQSDIFEPAPASRWTAQPERYICMHVTNTAPAQTPASCSTLMRAGRFREYTPIVADTTPSPPRTTDRTLDHVPVAPKKASPRPRLRREKRFEASLRAEGPRFEGYQPLRSPRNGFDLDAMSREEFKAWLLSGGEDFPGSDVVPLLEEDW
ncbi:hypothetical protein CLAFUW4_03933 [Fulvia fulva]|uniref:Uncharacterized protein n=1 Tax=Passalora fulva TaxID=5499 RepID=A0A9Q8P897_PASFU|nr:uncharacterized protein CLAFUR5_03901 [Fulvia fulva]KAK4627144.1 hypothetical protein CLAFUR4_03919 [Fulvia fulva]UJO16949.1 hypothetical protein CLAFUR5_03901 [Fulvia fulva]WPV13652.1 hypothetical protein CLAFUW4_03933 [Fulvia fulva]WPV29045.1 hypothetical protein CLAFUW7_03922 [Fulvia fulva]